MGVVNIAFHAVSLVLAIMAALLLLYVNKERKHSNRLLAIILILFAFQNLILILLFSRLILQLPWLLRILAPTTFLIAPLAFVYIRSVLNDELKFKNYDWLLLIPALLVLINFIPYYLLPVEEKIDYLNKNFYGIQPNKDTGKGIIPGKVYYLIRICWSAIFLYFGFRLIYQFSKKNSPIVLSQNKVLLNWLFMFNTLLTLTLIVVLLKIFTPVLRNTQFTVADILLGATILFICIQLFIRPQILYGVFHPITEDDVIHQTVNLQNESKNDAITATLVIEDATANTEEVASIINIGPTEQLRYKHQIENYFQDKLPFLNPEYSLEQLVLETKIPRYILSAFINREYGIGFREFLNRYRVEFFKTNLDTPAWRNLTLEAIAEECGFNSRSTFINNFKKIAGQTPSEYMKAQIGRQPQL